MPNIGTSPSRQQGAFATTGEASGAAGSPSVYEEQTRPGQGGLRSVALKFTRLFDF